MKLYRITIITPSVNIERGVWAEYMQVKDGQIIFIEVVDGEEGVFEKAVAVYPVNYTFITSIETKEEYDKRKSSI